MKVDNVVQVIGRGYVFIGVPDTVVHIGDKVSVKDYMFEVRGIEGWEYIKRKGILLSPNTIAGEIIKKGDEIEFI